MIEDKFHAAVNVIRSLPKDGPYQPSHDMMLKFYGLYKQATEGPCTEQKPSFYEVIKGYKWRAWNSLGSMSKTDAMKTYVDELKKIVETMSYSDDVATFIEVLGPFFEYVELPNLKSSDDNHNITDSPKKYTKEDLTKIFDVAICNGKGGGKFNGVDDSGRSDTPNGDSDVSPTVNLEEVHVNGYTIVDKINLDSKLNHTMVNGNSRMLNGVNGLSDHGSGSPNQDALSAGTPLLGEMEKASKVSLKKLTSDTDSDEEYSEPAETPELLQQKQKRNELHYDVVEAEAANFGYIMSRDAGGDSPVLEVVTYGGGDAADADRIRFTQAQQFQQGSGRSAGHGDNAGVEPSSSHAYRGGGRGGDRRRRDSDNPASSDRVAAAAAQVDINTQLILILQKIHQDLEAVVLRLDSLESQAFTRHQEVCALCQRRLGGASSFPASENNSWWPFPELSPRSTFFLLTWPLILHGAVKLLLFLKSRRRRKNAM